MHDRYYFEHNEHFYINPKAPYKMAKIDLHNDEDFCIVDFSGTLVMLVGSNTAGTIFHRQPENVAITPTAIEYWTSTANQEISHDDSAWVTDNNDNHFLRIIGGRPSHRKPRSA